jgi:manganese/zinc/iron transport system permease protein
MNWSIYDTWMLVVAILTACACAVPGTFLVLRRMSMMGDAISHAVLPGLVIAFVVSGSRASWPMFVGAAVVGVLTAYLTESVRKAGNVEEGASMGVVFTALFALGLVLVNIYAGDQRVDLDPGCVLYGMLETVSPDRGFTLLGLAIPTTALTLSIVFVVNLVLVIALFKEFRISSFDPALATTMGINSTLMHYLLMSMTAVTTVAAFEAVGSILVVAMLIVPAAAAHLLTDRLGLMLGMALVFAFLSAVAGHLAAILLPMAIGMRSSLTIAPMIVVVAGAMLLLVVLLAPRHGVISKLLGQLRLSVRIACEDVLGQLSRAEESRDGLTVPIDQLRSNVEAGPVVFAVAMRALLRRGRVLRSGSALSLTSAGRAAAVELLRSHRIWEAYRSQQMNLAPDHVHGGAHRLEHVPTDLADKVAEELSFPTHDPHGKPVPQKPLSNNNSPTA